MSVSQENLPKGNAEYINRLNKIKILNLIRESGEISRVDIANKTGISAPTITRIVDNLINEVKLVSQVGIGVSSGGRPPVILKFNGEDNYIIGIDWGRTHIYGVLSNLNAKTLLKIEVLINTEHNFKSDLDKVIEIINYLITNSKISLSQLRGIGVAVPGYVNKKTNKVEFSPNFKWKNVDIPSYIKAYFNVPVIVDTVARVMAMGELWYGIGDKIKDFVFVSLGYGIGAGIVSEGLPHYGFDGFAGEFGHTTVSGSTDSQIVCECGKTNCIECYASGRGIAQIAREKLLKNAASSLKLLSENNPESITTEMVAKAAQDGDNTSLEIFENAAKLLGVSIANMTHIINPEVVVIGGKVSNAGDFFFDKIKYYFDQQHLQGSGRHIKIVKSSFQNEAAVKGAISLILKELLNFKYEEE